MVRALVVLVDERDVSAVCAHEVDDGAALELVPVTLGSSRVVQVDAITVDDQVAVKDSRFERVGTGSLPLARP